MNKAWRDRLAAYDDEHLDERERAALDLLLDSDAEARQYLASLREDRQRYCEALATVTARPGFTSAVMVRVNHTQTVWWRQVVTMVRPRALEVCAAGLMVMVGLALVPSDRTNAAHQTCLNNLRTLGRGLLAYSEDWDHRLPDSSSWVQAVSSYGRSGNALTCPLDTRAGDRGSRLVSYGMPGSLSGASVSSLPDPSAQVTLRDAEGLFVKPRHGNSANAAFGDGHVAPVSVPGP
ncbi:MAG: hypothetical protein HZB16_13745 [Armatimonadetes bacterium]|nr:hypothetical protein [Armatimonadota bacterium]